jgi:hypothetical protein
MKTAYLLMAEFETPLIPLVLVAEKYLMMSERKAKGLASVQKLPFPVLRGSESQKSGWFVHVEDLSNYLDDQREKAKRTWETMKEAMS